MSRRQTARENRNEAEPGGGEGERTVTGSVDEAVRLMRFVVSFIGERLCWEMEGGVQSLRLASAKEFELLEPYVSNTKQV